VTGARASKPARLRELVRFLARRSRAPVVTKLAFALLAALITASAWWWFTARDATAVRPALPTSAAAQDGQSIARDARPTEDALTAGSESRVEVGPRSADLARIDVRVVTPDSTPVAGQTVVAVEPGAEHGWRGENAHASVAQPGECAQTDDRGMATLYVEPLKQLAVVPLAAAPEDSRATLEALAVAERRQVTLTVNPAPEKHLRGLVLDVVNRKPVEGAHVLATPRGPVLAHSDEHGRFVIAGLHPWRHDELCVTRAGFVPTKSNPDVRRGDKDAPLVMLMARAAAAEVRVVDASGEPVAALVRASVDRASIAGDAAFLVQSEWDAELEADEVAQWTQLPADVEIELTACSRLDWGLTQRVLLASGETPQSITLRLPPAETIVGRVTGLPSVAGVVVLLTQADGQATRIARNPRCVRYPSSSTEADAQGHFRFTSVPPGAWKVSVAQPGGELALAAARVSVAPGGSKYAVELRAEPAAWLRGRVDWQAELGPQVVVEAKRVDDLAWGEGRINASGRFELGPLPPGEYVVRIGGWIDVDDPHIRLFEGRLFRLAPGARVIARLQPGVQELELELEPIRGVGVELVDTQDLPVLGTAVFATGGDAVAVSTGTSNFARFAMRTADRVLTVHAWSYDRRLTAERTFHIHGEQTDAPLRLVLAPQPLPPASKAPPRLTK